MGKPLSPTEQRMKDHASEYRAAMTKLWAAGLSCFGSRWTMEYGEIDEVVYRSWGRSLASTFSPETIEREGVQILQNWHLSKLPALGQLRTTMSDHLRTSSGESERRRVEKKREITPGVAEKYLSMMAQMDFTGPRDEEFVKHYRNCGLHVRFGGDPKIDNGE